MNNYRNPRGRIWMILLIFLMGCTPQTPSAPTPPTSYPTDPPYPTVSSMPTRLPEPLQPAKTVVVTAASGGGAVNATPSLDTGPTITAIVVPTRKPQPTELEIDPIFNELGFFQGGGSGDAATCGSDRLALDYGEPDYDPEVIDVLRLRTCGWAKNEAISLTITDPSEKTYQLNGTASEKFDIWDNTWEFAFQPPPGSLPGSYVITWKGVSGTIKARFTFLPSHTPRIYVDSGDPFAPQEIGKGTGDRLVFINFMPGERITLRIKGGNPKTRTTVTFPDQSFTMDSSGGLRVSMDLPGYGRGKEDDFIFYTAQGEQSGSIKQFIPERTNSPEGVYSIAECPNAPPSRIIPLNGDFTLVDVVRVNGKALRIHAHPGFNTPVVINVNEGEQMGLFKWGKCVDGVYWWRVETMVPDVFGWAAESQDGKYLIEPHQSGGG